MNNSKNAVIVLVREDSEIKIEPEDLAYEIIKITYSGDIPPTIILPPHFAQSELDNTDE